MHSQWAEGALAPKIPKNSFLTKNTIKVLYFLPQTLQKLTAEECAQDKLLAMSAIVVSN